MSLTLKQLAMHILSLPEDVQELPACYNDDARYIFVDAKGPLEILYREPDGYGSGVGPSSDNLDTESTAYLRSLTKVAVIGG